MKKLWLVPILTFSLSASGQMLQAISGGSSFASAAAPTFSPAAGAVSNPTTVTASSTTSGTGCTIYFDANATPTTAQTTYSVTTGITLYAQVRNCVNYGDSPVSNAAYTISGGHAMVVSQAMLVNMTGGGAGPNWTASLTATPANADLLVGCTANTGSAYPTFSKTAVQLATQYSTSGSGLWCVPVANLPTGTTSFTITVGSAYVQGQCSVAVVTGLSTTCQLDTASNSGALARTAYSTSITTGVTPATSNQYDAAIGFAYSEGSTTFSLGSGYTTIQFAGTLGFEFLKLSSSSSTPNPPMTQSSSGYADAVTVAVYLQ